MAKPIVSIVMGSDSDLDMMIEAAKVLTEFGVSHEIQVLSAHRSPERVTQYCKNLGKRGIQIVIAGAGGAAHLAGVIAAHVTLPVIGVPVNSSSLSGLDSLLATVQMPSGIPVATVAIGKGGAANAGILAVQILSLGSSRLKSKLTEHKKKLSKSVADKNSRLQKNLVKKK
jgi:phosphoribosylaminoimidazole carboxylase PurE protein